MIGSKSATDMKQLAGKKIGVGRVGDPPYHMAVSLLRKYSFTARDVQWVSIGVEPRHERRRCKAVWSTPL